MSGGATAAFLAGWRQKRGARYTLVKIDLTSPSAQSLFIASDDFMDPDGRQWDGLLLKGSGPIRAPGSYMESTLSFCSCDLILARRKLNWQVASDDVSDLPWQFNLYGAVVTIYLWHADVPNGTGFVNFTTDRWQVFRGTVFRYESEPARVVLHVTQDRAWLQAFPPTQVSKTTYPSAPAGNIGSPLAVIYGDFKSPIGPAPFNNFIHSPELDAAVGGRLTIPGVLVDTGSGGADGTIVIASHTLARITDSDVGT